MKQRRFKLFAVLAAAVIGMGSMAGCARSQEETAQAPSDQPESEAGARAGGESETGTVADDEYGKYASPIQLSVIKLAEPGLQYDPSDPARKSAAENIWIDAYRDYLNIEVDLTAAEDENSLNALVNTAMANGTLPDVMVVGKEMFYSLMENEVLADISGAYETYTSTYGRQLSEVIATDSDALTTVTFDDAMYGIPRTRTKAGDSMMLWVRQDWLDEVGMEVPETIDEMTEVARAFKKAGLGGKNTIGIGIDSTVGGFSGIDGFIAAYGAVVDTWMQQEDGSYVYANTTEEMKDALVALAGLYEEGLLASDFAVSDTFGEDVANGVTGMIYHAPWYGVSGIRSSYMNDEDAEWTVTVIPTLDGENVLQWGDGSIEDFIVVNKDCEHPEAVLKMLELEFHLYYEPTPEEAAKYFISGDGVNLWEYRVFKQMQRADQNYYKAELIVEEIANDTPVEDTQEVIKSNYEQVVKGLEGDQEYKGAVDSWLYAFPIFKEKKLDLDMVRYGYNGPITDTMSLYQTTIDEALESAALKVIMGEDISIYEKAIETWYQSGGQQITEEVNEYYHSLS